MQEGPVGASYAATESGWVMDNIFEKWLREIFCKWLNKNEIEKPCVLLFDGHNSHLTFQAVRICQENDIIIVCIPPHTSHALQPLDVGLLRPLKIGKML